MFGRKPPEIIDAKLAWEQVRGGALLLDVRKASEFNSGHLRNALNFSHDELESRLAKLQDQKDREILVYCVSGVRSEIAKNLLIKNGFTRVVNAGSYEELLAAE